MKSLEHNKKPVFQPKTMPDHKTTKNPTKAYKIAHSINGKRAKSAIPVQIVKNADTRITWKRRGWDLNPYIREETGLLKAASRTSHAA